MTFDLLLGDCLEVMRTLPDQSVQCIVTSPPYWGLRDYGLDPVIFQNGQVLCQDGHEWGARMPAHHQGQVEQTKWQKADGAGRAGNSGGENFCQKCGAWRGQLGLEPTPELYIDHLVTIFHEARRVLRDDGTLWLNLGDSYAGGGVAGSDKAFNGKQGTNRGSVGMVGKAIVPAGLKPKDLVGIPWMAAFALRADGWYLRSDIIWHKPNPMPESVTDRPTKAHEYLFLLAKSERYYYDAEAIKEPVKQTSLDRMKYSLNATINPDPHDMRHGNGWKRTRNGETMEEVGFVHPSGRNRRSVWTVATRPYSGAHFATFPPALIEPMILAGTSARGECPHCGKAWVRVVERDKPPADVYARNGKPDDIAAVSHPDLGKAAMGQKLQNWYNEHPSQTTDWRPQCDCWEYAPDMPFIDGVGFKQPLEPIPQTVLDLFSGSGTTGTVSIKHGRNYIGIDCKPEYNDLARERIGKVQIEMQL